VFARAQAAEAVVSAQRVAIYARVSTKDQDPEVQLRELRGYAERRGDTVVEEYVDHGVSGAKDRRPALDRLMADARRRRFDAVVVWRFDRFARSVKHLVLALDEFQTIEVAFVSLREALDFGTPMGRAMFAVIGAMAELEREVIRERVRAGIAKARAAGKCFGRPRRWTNAQVESAARLRAEGASWRTIAQSVGLPVRTVRRALGVAKATPS
jgi:DNA invertase Pin-like site-specific DNA recombinase